MRQWPERGARRITRGIAGAIAVTGGAGGWPRPSLLLAPFHRARDALIAERERWALWSPAFFGMGIGVYLALPVEPDWRVLAIGCAVVAAMTLLSFRYSRGGAALWLLPLCIICFGGTLIAWKTERIAAPVLDRPQAFWGLSGLVTRVEPFPEGARVRLEHLAAGNARDALPHAVRVKLKRGAVPMVGDWIALNAKLSPPPEPSFPGAYDFARVAWFDQLGGVGFSLSDWRVVEPRVEPGLGQGAWIALGRFRADLSARIKENLPGREGAIMAALLTGDRAGVPDTVMEDLRRSGLAHLLAISGLHIGMVAFLIFGAVRLGLAMIEPLARDYPIKKWAAIAAFLAGGGYLLLAGATVPTQRAFLMTGFVLLAVLVDRQAISMRLVAVAAGIVLLISPDSLVGASFQLSFAAVVALVAVYESYRFGGGSNPRERSWAGRIAFYFGAVALTTLIAGAATAPFALYHFGRVAHYGLLANVLAIPIVTFWIMPLGLFSLLLMPFGWEAALLVPAGMGVELVLGAAEWVAQMPGAVGHLPQMPDWGLACVVIGGLWAAIWRLRWRYLGLFPMALGVFSPQLSPGPIAILHASGEQAAIVWDGRLWVERIRRDRFAQSVWSEKFGMEIGGDWRDLTGIRDGPIRCDPLGCVLTLSLDDGRAGTVLAFTADPRAMREDCRQAALTRLPIQPHPATCRETIALGPATLKRNGAHALYWSAQDGLMVETVRARRGDRPWVR